MTIPTSLPIRDLNRRLGYLERCAETAPAGTYEHAKDAAAVIGEIADHIMSTLRALGLEAPGDDSLRAIEAAVFGYIVQHNPLTLATAEGFGEHVDGPAGARIIAQAAANLESYRAAQARQQ